MLCQAHNQLRAEQAFGREVVERSRRFRQHRQQKSTTKPGGQAGNLRQQKSTTTLSEKGGDLHRSTFEKVRLALRGLGFRDLEVRRAVAAIASGHDANEPFALERALREALFILTAA